MKKIYLLILENSDNLNYILKYNWKDKVVCFECKKDAEEFIKNTPENSYLLKEIVYFDKQSFDKTPSKSKL